MRSWMERGRTALLRHLERESSHYTREMSWSKRLQKRLRVEISARLPDAVVRRLSHRPWCGALVTRRRASEGRQCLEFC